MLSTSTALVPYDRTFTAAEDRWAYRQRWNARLLAEHVQKTFEALSRVVKNISAEMTKWAEAAGRAFSQAYTTFQSAGLAPPDPTNMLCGQRWVSPIDGVKWRVAGRRGNRHWIEAGPRGWRRP